MLQINQNKKYIITNLFKIVLSLPIIIPVDY